MSQLRYIDRQLCAIGEQTPIGIQAVYSHHLLDNSLSHLLAYTLNSEQLVVSLSI